MLTHKRYLGLKSYVETRFGRIAYASFGSGPVALFIHGVPLNGYHWRHQLTALSDIRRCIAPDLLGLGDTEPAEDASLNFAEQAEMLVAFLDALDLDAVDLVGNDSGGAIAMIFACKNPARVRTLTLTNCDVHDNWPPPAFMPAFLLASKAMLGAAMADLPDNLGLARSDFGLGTAFEFPDQLTDETVRAYLAPLVVNPRRMAMLDRYVAAMDNRHTVALEQKLSLLKMPTLIAWGEDDVFFPVEWAHWLAERIPGASAPVTHPTARLFFAEERPEFLNCALREHWKTP